MEILTRVHAKTLVEWAKHKPEVVVFSADLTSSAEADLFKAAYPDRFFSLGIAEQNMMSFAGGMAREGFVPLVHTFAVFMYRRAYDQVAISIAYPNLPVKMFGFLPGILTPGRSHPPGHRGHLGHEYPSQHDHPGSGRRHGRGLGPGRGLRCSPPGLRAGLAGAKSRDFSTLPSP